MFSSTTMLSSTSTPIAVVRPISVMVFRVRPGSRMTISATSSEVGIASSTMIVLRRLCRKRNSTRPVISAASISSSWTPSHGLADDVLWSMAISQLVAGRQLAVDLLDQRAAPRRRSG